MSTGAARRGWTWLLGHSAAVLLVLTASGLAFGLFLHLAGVSGAGDAVWAVVGGCGAAYALWAMADALRHGRVGVDVIALLAAGGALVVGELLAAAVIAVMLASGRALEAWAAGRAHRDLHALLERAPRTARLYRGQALEAVPLDAVMPGDLLLVAPGELVPVDGSVVRGAAVLDESALTGEARPVERAPREPVRSGVLNAGGPFDLRATATAADSTYAGIVRLVSEAEASQAPFVRLADRYAVWFLLVSLAWAGAAWLVAGPARAVAVLVVATPCPLILAAPVALVSGLSVAARRGVVVKGGGVLERLAQCTTLLLDKTGTLTSGHPQVAGIIPAAGQEPAELLRLAASLDQVSVHVLAGAVVEAAAARGGRLVLPQHVEEVPGQGIRGTVGAHRVAVGRAGWAGVTGRPGWVKTARRRARLDGALTVFVAIDGEPAGVLILNDPLRPDAARTIQALRDGGISRILMVTGDQADVAHAIGTVIGVDEVLAERTPAGKLDAVRAERDRAPVIMVGDGINDAPALALADVGVAMGARGSSASSEAADAVLTVDRLDRLGEIRVLARRTRRIAMQSVLAGMGMSVAAMAVAAAAAAGRVGCPAAGSDRRRGHTQCAAGADPGYAARAADGRRRRTEQPVFPRARNHPGGHRAVARGRGRARSRCPARSHVRGQAVAPAPGERDRAARESRAGAALPGDEPGAGQQSRHRRHEQDACRDRPADQAARAGHRRHRHGSARRRRHR